MSHTKTVITRVEDRQDAEATAAEEYFGTDPQVETEIVVTTVHDSATTSHLQGEIRVSIPTA